MATPSITLQAQNALRRLSAWPFQQIADWEKEQQTLCRIMYRAQKYFPQKDYMRLFEENNEAKPSERYYLIY